MMVLLILIYLSLNLIAPITIVPGGLNLVTKYTYDSNGNKLTATDALGRVTTFVYDSRNRLIKTILADQTSMQMVYDARGNKIKDVDENNNATLYKYDSLNRVISMARDMNGDGVIDAGDIATSYQYNQVGSKTRATSPLGGISTMSYDSLQRVVSMTTSPDNALQYTTTFAYGANCGGNVFDSSCFKPTHTVDPRGYTSDVVYDALYRPVSTASVYNNNAAPAMTSQQYDPVGNVQVSTDALGRSTEMTYDALDRPIITTLPDGNTMSVAYTSTGFKYTMVDPNKNVSYAVFDNAGRPIESMAPAVPDPNNNNILTSPTSTTTYDLVGNVLSTKNALGQIDSFTYDVRNRKLTETEPAVVDASTTPPTFTQPTMSWTYDSVGNTTSVTDARGYITTSQYDVDNRVTDVREAAVLINGQGAPVQPHSSTTYDLDSNALTTTDADGHTTLNTYDLLNRLLSTQDAAGITVTNTYDQVGDKLTVTDGKNQTTTFAYDGFKRNLTISDPAHEVTTSVYDPINKVERIDALTQVTSYTYDLRNRLSVVDYGSLDSVTNSPRTYSYDPDGNLVGVAESLKPNANIAHTYDALNRSLTETSGGLTHTSIYDLLGNRLTIVYGGTGRTISSTYDALDRLSTMTETGRVTQYAYDLNSNIVIKTLPNGDTIKSSFDALDRAMAMVGQSQTGTLLYNNQYGFDLVGNVTSEQETYSSGLNNRLVSNTYDPIYRLLSEAVTGQPIPVTTNYTYDSANNRTSKVIIGGPNAGTTNYTLNNLNQITNYNDSGAQYSATLSYDANGNRISQIVVGTGAGTDSYSYDIENRMVGVTKGSGTIGLGSYAYQYDYRTRRITRNELQAGGSNTQLIFSGGTSVQEYDNGAARPTVEYVRGSDYGGGVGGILYTLRGGEPSYTHENKRGDVIAKTDRTGSLTYQAQYQAFSTRPQENGSTQDRQKGNSKDEDLWGALNEGMRYRDLVTDTFFTKDPAGMIDGPNEYTYVRQNPWSSFDPMGLDPDLPYGVGQGMSSVVNDDNIATSSKTPGEAEARIQAAHQDYDESVRSADKTMVGTVVGAAISAAVMVNSPEIVSGGAIGLTARVSVAGISGMTGGYVGNGTTNELNGQPFNQNAPAAVLVSGLLSGAGPIAGSIFNKIAGVSLSAPGSVSASTVELENPALTPSTTFQPTTPGRWGGSYEPYDNSSGGTLWLAKGIVNLKDEKAIISQNNLDPSTVTTLQGFHGSPSGIVTMDPKLVSNALASYNGTGVSVINAINQTAKLNVFASSPDHTVAAWCDSSANFLPSGNFTSPFPPLPPIPPLRSPLPPTAGQ